MWRPPNLKAVKLSPLNLEYLGWLLDSGEYAAFEEPELPAFWFDGPHHTRIEYKAIYARDADSIRRFLESVLGRESAPLDLPAVPQQEAFEVPF